MNPLFMAGLTPPPRPKTFWGRIFGIAGFFGNILLADVCFWKREKLREEEGSILGRLIHGLMYRLIFAPVLAMVLVVVLVYAGTHPARVKSTLDPNSVGVPFNQLQLTSADGTQLEAWIAWVLNPRRIMESGEEGLLKKYPAVLLVHDHANHREQMLPLVKAFHEAGFVVLVPTLRGTPETPVATTFGLREADDVLAALELLRRQQKVDSKRIVLLGVGTGANAAVIAASRDQNVAALVLDRPVTDAEGFVLEHVGPPQEWLKTLKPICRWTFEAVYRLDVDDLSLDRNYSTVKTMPVLVLDQAKHPGGSFRQSNLLKVQDFIARQVLSTPRKDATAGVDR
jgi:pimeloyl-ACP methyl ester carboxylesterase